MTGIRLFFATSLVLVWTAAAAFAEVCGFVVPDDGSLLAYLFLYLPEIIVLIAAATAYYFDMRGGLFAAAAVTIAYVALSLVGSAGDVQAAMRAEGCAAPRFLAPVVYGALALFLVTRAFRSRSRERGEP